MTVLGRESGTSATLDAARLRQVASAVPIRTHLPRLIADAVTLDPSIPPNLALDVWIERFILELLTSERPTGSAYDQLPLRGSH